jgi:Rieske Fe-S protein
MEKCGLMTTGLICGGGFLMLEGCASVSYIPYKPAGDLLICPCHGSEYSSSGKVLQPPAEKDLYSFGIKTDSENIYINVRNN